MTLNPREKKIAIGVSAAVGLLALNQFVLSPFVARQHDIDDRRSTLQTSMDDAHSLFSREQRLRKIWNDMQQGGLNVDASQAESAALQAIIAWADKAGMTLSALKPERSTEERKFEVISFNVTGTGAMPDVARMMWAMETAPIPLRVNDVQITPRREGTDDLSARFSVSALCLPPQSGTGTLSTGATAR